VTSALAGPAASGGALPAHLHATPLGRDRLIRQEVSLGIIREMVPPQTHIGLQLFPFLEVPTDDVIFSYLKGDVDGLAPARAEDAESELAQKDDMFVGEGRASLIDWSLKNHYTSSDVSKYREWLTIQEKIRDTHDLPLTVNSMVNEFQGRILRDDLKRKRRLDNRLEWLIMTQAMATGQIIYNDGKTKFGVDYQRPSAQQARTPAQIQGGSGTAKLWDDATGDQDPIRDLLAIQQYMYDTYGVRMTRGIASAKLLNSIMKSTKFMQRSGVVVSNGAGGFLTGDPNYVMDGWGPKAAIAIVEQQTGIRFETYDSVYRTRPIGSTTITANRFFPQSRLLLLPDEADVQEFDDTEIGMGRTLTSPHPANNWQPGWYDWEFEYGVDPWGLDRGTGIKAFPVFPHMDLTYTLDPIAA
jgi:hypothetical protein